MSVTLLRGILALVFAFHGVGHTMGVIAALGIDKAGESSHGWLQNWSSQSWLLSGLLGDTLSRALGVLLYGAALIGVLGAALSLLGWGIPHEWWRSLAVVSAIISLVALLLFWNALMMLFPHKVGALAVNIATLVCLLVLHWPSETDLGF